jgi:HK97 family phage major capsid protein
MEKKLKELRAKRVAALESAKAITENAKKEDRGLTDDEGQKVDSFLKDADEAKANIEKCEADQQRINRLNEAEEWGNSVPNNQASDDLPIAGQNHQSRQGNARVVGGQGSPSFRHLGEFFMSVVRAETGGGRDARLVFSDSARADAPGLGQNSLIPSDGGYLIPPNFSTALLEEMNQESMLLSLLDQYSLTVGNGTTLPYVEETSRATGSRFGGVRAYWRQQGDTVDPSKIKYGELEIKLKDLMAVGYATNEMLSDAVFTGDILQRAFASELAFVAEDSVINGTGSGQPLGFLNSGCKIEVAKESGQANDSLVGQNVVKMWSRMPARFRRTAVWLYNTELEPDIAALSLYTTAASGASTATAALPLVIPAGTGINQTQFATLYNRPLIPMEQCAAAGTVGDIILADPQQYLWITKGGMDAQSSMHVRFLYNEQTFRITFRADGQPKKKSAVTPYKGSNSVSPIVTVAER